MPSSRRATPGVAPLRRRRPGAWRPRWCPTPGTTSPSSTCRASPRSISPGQPLAPPVASAPPSPARCALLRRLRPQVVVSVGGYASVPPVLAAWSCGSRRGRQLRRRARRRGPPAVPPGDGQRRRLRHVAAAPPGGHRRPAAPRRSSASTGPADQAGARAALGLPPDRFTLLVVGGSLGSGSSTTWSPRLAAAAAPTGRTSPSATSCGSRHDAGVVRAAGAAPTASGTSWCATKTRMHLAYAAADLVLARAGATTVAELAASGTRRSWCRGRWPPRTTRRPTPGSSPGAGGALLVPDAELDAGAPAAPRSIACAHDPALLGLDGGAGPLGRRPRRRRSHRRAGRALRSEALVNEHVSEPGTPVAGRPDRARPLPRRRASAGPGMRAIALVLAEMGHHVSGSDLRESARARPAAGGRASPCTSGTAAPTSTASTPSPRPRPSPPATIELVAAARARHPGAPARRHAGVDLRLRPLRGRRRHPRQDHDHLDAGHDPRSRPGCEPSFLVGGDVNDVGAGAHWTGGRRCWWWRPTRATARSSSCPLWGTILTNVEADHLDHFGTFDAIVAGFDRYLGQRAGAEGGVRRRSGRRRAGRRRTAPSPTAPRRRPTSGRRRRGRQGLVSRSRCAATASGSGEVHLPLRGIHMARNATGAIAMAHGLRRARSRPRAPGWPASAAWAAASTSAASTEGITLVDDYAHLPSEIAAVLDAARHGRRRLGAARGRLPAQPLQPHGGAVAGVPGRLRGGRPHRRSPTSTRRARRPSPASPASSWSTPCAPPIPAGWSCTCRGGPTSSSYLAAELRAGDVCVSMGCGDVASLPSEVLARLTELDTGVGTGLDAGPDAGGPSRDRGHRRRARIALDHAAAALGSGPGVTSPIGPLTTYRVGGQAALFVEAETRRRPRAVAGCRAGDAVAGARGRAGLEPARRRPGVPRVSSSRSGAFATTIELPGPDAAVPVVRAGAGVLLPVLARQTAAAGLTGLEWAVGVPGSVGGAVRMNAGGHGSDIAACLVGVRVLDLATRGG